MKPYFFSIVIPVYNCERYIIDCIQSVLSQEFKDYEVIIIDDCSQDNTRIILSNFLKELNKTNFQLIHLDRNYTTAHVRNEGIIKAQGRYIAFLDADDIWYPLKLKSVYDYLQVNMDAIIVCHDLRVVYKNKIIDTLSCGPYEEPMFNTLLFGGNRLALSASVVLKEAILKAGLFSEKVMHVEDYDLWLRLSRLYKIYFLKEVLGNYRITENGVSTNFFKFSQSAIEVVEHYYKKYFKEKGIVKFSLLLRNRKANIFHESAVGAFIRKRIRDAILLIVFSLIQNPLYWRNFILFLQIAFLSIGIRTYRLFSIRKYYTINARLRKS